MGTSVAFLEARGILVAAAAGAAVTATGAGAAAAAVSLLIVLAVLVVFAAELILVESEEALADMERGNALLASVMQARSQVWVQVPTNLPRSQWRLGDFYKQPNRGMTSLQQCASIRGVKYPGEQCKANAKFGEWCGHHKHSQQRFIVPEAAAASAAASAAESVSDTLQHDMARAARRIQQVWRRWLARRAGPLLWARAESNNPYDFFSSDPVDEIPLREFVSFVDADSKGYIMDIKSATSLLEHSKKMGETPKNPFNRAPLPALFIRRIAIHGGHRKGWSPVVPVSEKQAFELAVTDVFRHFEDLGYYTNPTWYLTLGRAQLQQLYIEIADIWYHRAMLTASSRARIVPAPARILPLPVTTVLVMSLKALQRLLLESCRLLVSASAAKSDRQLGAMYVLGALVLVSPDAASAYPWLVEMFAPGITRIAASGQIMLQNPGALAY